MNKKTFEKFINDSLKDIPLEKFEQELLKMKNDWIPQILEKKKKNHIKCSSCGKYSKIKDFKTEEKIEVNVETTFTDAGYGDDDMLGEVERIYVYRICPICQKKEVQSKHFLRIIREWKRCDYKK